MAKFTTVELYSSDAAASAAFMADLFQYENTAYGDSYVDVHVGDGFTVAFETITEDVPPPLVIFQVENLDRAQAAVEAAGGVITVAQFDFPGGRRFQFREPGGNELSLWAQDEA